MASFMFNRAMEALVKAGIDYEGDTFHVVLGAGGQPDKDTLDFYENLTGELVSGNGYTQGGKTVSTGVSLDLANDRVEVAFGSASWPSATITAEWCCVVRWTGVAATSEVVAFGDYGGPVSSTNGTFQASFSSPFRIQN